MVAQLPDGVEHTMFFMGVGDHGGGPNFETLKWIAEHPEPIPGTKLIFSSPTRFFAAIEKSLDKLPMVTGDLQEHAIGCYSVYRPIKLAVRRAEHALAQVGAIQTLSNKERTAVQTAWQQVAFNHFHDTFGGTCTPSAYVYPEGQLGGVIAMADELLNVKLRRAWPNCRKIGSSE